MHYLLNNNNLNDDITGSIKKVKFKKVPSKMDIDKLIKQFRDGSLNDAGKTAVSLIQQFPNDQFSWKVLGVILKQLGKFSEALLVTKQAIKINPKDFKAYNNL